MLNANIKFSKHRNAEKSMPVSLTYFYLYVKKDRKKVVEELFALIEMMDSLSSRIGLIHKSLQRESLAIKSTLDLCPSGIM